MKIKKMLVPMLFFSIACQNSEGQKAPVAISEQQMLVAPETIAVSAPAKNLSEAALLLTQQAVTYNPSYFVIPYPNGDVPPQFGVCTDVVIRAYRHLGVDLQKLVHEDMAANFDAYPKKWGLKKTDRNIDHRRVPNLQTFFARKGIQKPISDRAEDYVPGDVVTWLLGGKLTHIGIVVDKKSEDGKRFLVVHNIGAGQVLQDCLFDYQITGCYRYPR